MPIAERSGRLSNIEPRSGKGRDNRTAPNRFAPDMRLLLLVRAMEQSRAGLTVHDMREAMAINGHLPSRSTVERAKRAVSLAYPEIECVNVGEGGQLRWRLPKWSARPIPLTADELAVTCTPDWYRSEVESFALMADG